MFKKLLLIIVTFFMPFTAYSTYCSPPRPARAEVPFFSPEKSELEFTKFRDQLVLALNDNDIKKFHKIFMNYFNTIVYPMQIKSAKYYAALFYCIFQEISNSAPIIDSAPFDANAKSAMETITVFVSNSQKQYFAFEIFIYSGEDNANAHGKPLTPEIINEHHNYGHLFVGQSPTKSTGSERIGKNKTPSKKAKTIRMFIDVDEIIVDKNTQHKNRHLIMDSVDTSEVARFKLFYPEDCVCLNVDDTSTSYIRTIIHEFDQTEPDFCLVRAQLEAFYNSIPKNFTKPFRVKTCEKFYHALFYNMLNLLRFNASNTEYYTKEGRIDILLYTTVQSEDSREKLHRPLIIEFKHHGRAPEALKQIKERNYFGGLTYTDEAQPIMVGININSDVHGITVDKIAYESYTDTTTPLKTSKLKRSTLKQNVLPKVPSAEAQPLPPFNRRLDFSIC